MMIKKLKNNSLITLTIIALFSLNTTNAQVGIGTTSPDESASLELQSTTKGFLPPRLTTTERGDITSPAVGLTIYNKEVNCLQWFNGSGWFDACDGSTFVAPVLGSGFTNGFQDNDTCTTKLISVTPCSAVSGTTESTVLADGTLYDWTDAGSYMSGGTANALVEIGGQCWFGRNTIVASSAPIADAPNNGDNVWVATSSPGDIGLWGYYDTSSNTAWATSENATGEGLLYQWSAAMNGDSTERAQGVCPTGWHVPSDCEWMYLEDTLGMDTADQQLTGWRNSGSVASKLSNLTSSPTNSSGFTALLAGFRNTNGAFFDRGTLGFWWSSSEAGTADAQSRVLFSFLAGVGRFSDSKAYGFSVRCLKD